MADELDRSVPDTGPASTGYDKARREPRHPVPAVYQRYIDLKVMMDDTLVPVILHNVSSCGVLFESQVPFEIGAHAHCIISLPRSLSQEITFYARVKHCRKELDAFFVGAAIRTADDPTWFNVFLEVHDYIMKRQGEVY